MFDDDENPENSDLVKNLRKQIEKLGKEKADAIADRDKALGTVRTTSVKAVLTELGASQKLATYMPADLEPTEEAVRGWLDENADVFNFKAPPKVEAPAPQTSPVEEKPAEPAVDADAWGRIQNPESAVAPDISSATAAWLASITEAAAGDVEKFSDLYNAGPPTT